MIPSLVLATNNPHKVKEIRAILKKARLRLRILTLDSFPKRPPVVENKSTLKGNAAKKAVEVARRTKHLSLADDTGLFVDALGGRPGVFSARFAGPACSFEDNNRKLLRLLEGRRTKTRGASFRCVAALATPSGKVFCAEGRIRGKISFKPIGRHGFGYDPVFLVPGLNKTFAELTSKIKNRISHRAKAFSRVPKLLRRALKSI